MEMKKINNDVFEGERALYNKQSLIVTNSVFQNGESPLKECTNIEVEYSTFKWKYPLWYTNNVKIINSSWSEMARAGVWYSNNISVENSVVAAPKNFRRCNGLSLKNVFLPNAQETLWNCKNVTLDNVNVKGDYFAMNCENMNVQNSSLVGGYSFDGVKNIEITNSQIITKDAFWNSENVTVRDSFISSDYLGWNAKNLTLINCTIETLQGMCYLDNLVMRNCTLINASLAFECSTVDVDINGHIHSIKNPISGIIKADSIGEIILEEDKIDPTKIKIIFNKDIKKKIESL